MNPNASKLAALVAGHIAIARGKSPDAARKHLLTWAAWTNEQMYLLAKDGPMPRHLIGLNVFDLSNARDALSAAVPAEAA